MTIDEAERFDPETADRFPWGLSPAWGLGLLGAFALLVFELTAHPGLTVAIACSRVAWSDLQAGYWVRRVDPHRGRGAACSWFLWSIAMVKTTAIAVVALIGLIILSNFLGAGPPLAPQAGKIGAQTRGALYLLLLGFLATMVIGWFGVFSALRHRVRVWVGQELRDAWRSRAWPPPTPAMGRVLKPHANSLRPILLMTLFPGMFPVLFLCVLIAERLPPGRPAALIMVPLAFLLVGGLVSLLYWLWTRALADHPAQCWPEAVGQAPQPVVARPPQTASDPWMPA